MRRTLLSSGLFTGLFAVASLSQSASAAVLTQFNFGASSASVDPLSQYETATTVAANTSASTLSLGSQTTPATNNATTGYTSPTGNYLSVQNVLANDDSAFYANFTVTAATGFAFTPTSFTIVGGKGGSSNARSYLLFDSVDGMPTSVTATATTPTSAGATPVGTNAFAAVRGTSVPMDSFTSNFSSSIGALTSFQIRVYFDTQAGGQQKNIDLGSLTLNGTVSPTPEPAMATLAVAGLLFGARRRRLA